MPWRLRRDVIGAATSPASPATTTRGNPTAFRGELRRSGHGIDISGKTQIFLAQRENILLSVRIGSQLQDEQGARQGTASRRVLRWSPLPPLCSSA